MILTSSQILILKQNVHRNVRMIFPFDAWKGRNTAWLWTNWLQLVNEYDGVGALEKRLQERMKLSRLVLKT